jgi:pseudouridine synthase
MEIRLNKYLSQAGVASRREADRLIAEGRVLVNGQAVMELGTRVDPERDKVQADGRAIKVASGSVYVMLNKPVGYLVTLKDPFGRPTVRSLMPKLKARVFPVGRLDAASEGLLLLTNDGELAHRLSHPRFEVKKVYVVKVRGVPEKESLRRLERGLVVEGRKTAPARAALLSHKPGESVLRVELHEGRKREVRKMCEMIGHPVLELRRTEYAGLALKHLKTGEWRLLTSAEVARLRRQVGLE